MAWSLGDPAEARRPITEKSVEGRAQSRAEQERAKRHGRGGCSGATRLRTMDAVAIEQDRLSEALSTIHDVVGHMRRLQDGIGANEICTSDKVDLNDAHNIAQICQGVGFIGLAMWLIFANNSKARWLSFGRVVAVSSTIFGRELVKIIVMFPRVLMLI
eukprot:Skav235920  [mRNA]  locus=scaffold2493:67212:73855:+ [translate_table: standard]